MGVKAQDLQGVDQWTRREWAAGLKGPGTLQGTPRNHPKSLPVMLQWPLAHTPPVGSCYIRGAGLSQTGATAGPGFPYWEWQGR